ncbi:MAG: FAD/NAD(P)-binding oxidoreductase [Negativicutes bacterium]|nr:FAD/NAD(P)-binding oxidoreductase [Negativicutes bacterium]
MPTKVEKLHNTLMKKGYPGIECSEWHNSIKLEGELGNWQDIVEAGKVATKFGYKGVVNEVKLRGFIEPAIRAPKVVDGAIDNRKPDVVIIGGGVIGCSIARELSRYNLDILLLEKESDVAMHASSRNDGMIHPGIASHANTLRGKMNVKGNEMYTKLCKELDIPFERHGNFILFSNKALAYGAGALFKYRSKHYGIEMEYVNRQKLEQLEPNITDEAVAGYSFPSSGVLSPYKLTVALAESAVENGTQISLDTIVTSMVKESGKITSVHTNRGTVYPKTVINAAGVFSDNVAAMADDKFFSIHPRKGEIVILDKKKGLDVTRSMGLVSPDMIKSTSKGGGVMRTIDNNVLVGPDAYEQPLKEDFSTHRENIQAVMDKHLKLIKTFQPSDTITYFSGIRACTYEEEFVIERSEYVKNLIHAAGIQSPGFASAPAIAEEISKITVDVLSECMQVVPNDKFNPCRLKTPHLDRLSFEEKQKVIKKNPDYGVIVCRCEEISRGEIIDAINSPLPATSVDAIKRRIRPGMGRCQGGFCAPLVTKIICEQTGLTPDQITKSGGDSNLLFEKTPKGGASK